MSAQLELLGVDADEAFLVACRVRACIEAGLPASVAECVAVLTKNTANGNPSRTWEVMTPSRYVHAADLVRAGCDPSMVVAAIDRIHASAWLRIPALRVTDADLSRAAAVAVARGVAT